MATVELVFLLALMVLVTFGGVHLVAYLHAKNLAAAAAQDAARAASAADLAPAQAQDLGQQAAHRLLDGEASLTGVTITVNRDSATATATITGRSLEVIPGSTWTVDVTAQAGVERFVGRGQP